MPYLSKDKIKLLEEKASEIRETADELIEAGFPDVSGQSSAAEIISAFYFYILKHNPQKPDWLERDRFIVADSNLLPPYCAGLMRAGYFSKGKIENPADLSLPLPGMEVIPNVSGSGLAQAIGTALAGRLQDKTFRTYCLVSDEEHNKGTHWESVMFAGKERYELNRLTLVVVRDNVQTGGMTEDVMPLEPLVEKYQDFNWHVSEVDGHNTEAIFSTVREAEVIYEAPSVIIAHTKPDTL